MDALSTVMAPVALETAREIVKRLIDGIADKVTRPYIERVAKEVLMQHLSSMPPNIAIVLRVVMDDVYLMLGNTSYISILENQDVSLNPTTTPFMDDESRIKITQEEIERLRARIQERRAL